MKGIELSSHECKSPFENYNSDCVLTEAEKIALTHIREAFIEAALDFDALRFCRRSDNYLTVLAPNDMDFLRLKVSDRSTWFSIHGLNLPVELKSDPRFDLVKKSLVHWKIKLSGVEEFKDNSDLIVESYVSIKDI